MFEEVGHAQWVFVMPKMLRPYFLHHRDLLGGLARAAWETVRELMVAATGGAGLRPGMVAIVQTAGDLANWHPCGDQWHPWLKLGSEPLSCPVDKTHFEIHL